jgi:CDP-diacylglycerol---serine O-phosphatidyltransferase
MITSIKNHIPNSLTLGNLLCGCIGIVYATEGNLINAAYLIGLACVFDFLDGFTARGLGVSSPIGKELDSLADMVTFGVLPGFIMAELLKGTEVPPLAPYLAFLIPVFSALRLAKFNIDTRQSDEFIGLPTPANALLIGFLIFVPDLLPFIDHENATLLYGIVFLSCYLLVSPIRMLALKFKNFKWQGNQLKFAFLMVSVLLLLIWREWAVTPIILCYIIISIISHLARKKQTP